MMNRILGKPKATPAPAPPPDIDAHVSRLNQKVPELDTKIQQYDQQLMQIKKQLASARTPAQQTKLKQQAMSLLSRKKMAEKQRNSYDVRAMNMERMQFAVDTAKEAQETYEVQKYLHSQMQSEFGKVNVDAMEDLHYDMDDLLADADEINDVLSRDYSIGAVNEDDLNAEFANLDSELEGLGDLDDIGQANMNPGMANSNSIPVAQPYDPDLAALMGNNGTNNGNNTASWMLPSPPTGSTTTVPQNRVPTSVMGSSSSTSGYGGR